ncbi:hypothetical protein ADUPG1_013690, partial [Aduncisulcus paluster]
TPKPLIAPPYNAQRKAYPKSQKPTRVVDHVEDRDPDKPPRKEEEEEEKEEEEEEKEEERSGSDDERRSYLESSISDGPVPLCQDSLSKQCTVGDHRDVYSFVVEGDGSRRKIIPKISSSMISSSSQTSTKQSTVGDHRGDYSFSIEGDGSHREIIPKIPLTKEISSQTSTKQIRFVKPSFDAIWTTLQNFIRRKSPYRQKHINTDQNLRMEHDKEEEEFSRSSTQSDYDNQGDPDDPGDMDSRTSTQDIQSDRPEKETIIAQDMDKSSDSSVSSPSSSSSTFPSDSASSRIKSTIPQHLSHSDIPKGDHGSDSSSYHWSDQYALPGLPSINGLLHPSSSEPQSRESERVPNSDRITLTSDSFSSRLHSQFFHPSSHSDQSSDLDSSRIQSTITPRPSYSARHALHQPPSRESIAKSDDIILTSSEQQSREATLTSASSITPLCIIGRGGFGEVLLVDVHDKGVDSLCVLKKMIHVGSLDLVRMCRKEFKIQRKLYENCRNRISRPIFILDLLDKEYNGSFGFIMEYCAGGSVKEFNRSWCIKNVSLLKDSSSDLASFPHRFDPMTLDPLKVSALCVEIIECLADVFKTNPGFVHRDIKPENFLIKVDRKSSECTAVLSDHGLALIKRSVTLGYLYSESSSTGASQKSSKLSTNHVLCGTFGYDSFEALQGMYSQKSDAYSLGITILALFQCCNPFYEMRLLQNASSPIEFVGKLKKLIKMNEGPKLSSSPLFASILTVNSGEFESVHTCLNEVFEGLTTLEVGKRMSVHEACEKVQSIKPLPKIGEGWKYPSIDDIVKAQVAKYRGYRGYIAEKESESIKESDDTVSSTFIPSKLQSNEKESRDIPSYCKEQERTEKNYPNIVKTQHIGDSGYIQEANSGQNVLPQGWEGGFSHPTESNKTNASSSVLREEEEEDLGKESEILKLRLKIEEKKRMDQETRKRKKADLKADDVMVELKTSILSIKRTESQPAITSLYKESYPRLKAIFDEFASSSPSAITSNIDLFELCFECLSLFVKHKVTKRDGTLKEDKDDIEVILDSSSIKNINDTFLPSMIRVENILRVKEEEEEEEEEDGRTGEAGVNSITMLLFRIIGVSTVHVEYLFFSIFPQISPLLSKMFILGLSKKFEDSFIEDILQTCRNIAFAKDDPTKNSLLSLLLPHILPWMKKYPDKKFFFLWTNILKNITNDKDNIGSHKDRSSQLWFVFHPVLDVIKDTASKGITFDDDAVIRCLLFFVNLSCIPSQAVEVHDCIKDGLLDGWFEMIKKKSEEGKDDGNWGIKYWSRLISMFSSVPSLVHHISPKYDTNMEWCKNNVGLGWSLYYSRYLGNCYPSLKKWSDLVESINKCPDSESTSKLYHKHRDEILSVFLAFQSKSEIEEHKREIVLCVQCLKWFVVHDISGNHIYLPIPDLNDLIDTFIGHLSRCEEVLEGDVDEEYCRICVIYTFKVHDKKDSFLPKISPTFQHILDRGSKGKLGGNVAPNLLNTLKNLSISPSSSTRSSIFTLIKPYIRDWLRIYNDSKCYGRWMFILSHITLSSDNKSPNKSICSEVWSIFHPVLDVVKRDFVGDKIVGNIHERVLLFFSNLCCDPLHAVEVYDNVKDLLDGWFTVIKKEEHDLGIKYWSRLISIFSTVPSLVPFISSRYDDNMEWCYKNGGLNEDFSRYLENYNIILRLVKLIDEIKKCDNIESISKLYIERRNEILSVFLAYQTNHKEHTREIILCVQCLRLFVQHSISENNIYLPIPDLNDLIDTFIDHLSRCEEVLEDDVDEEYCRFCVIYTFKVKDKLDSFLPKISPTFQSILERGSKEKLGGDVALRLLSTLRNISISTSSSTRSSILTLIKPYIRDWLRIYNDSKCYGSWMVILSHITLSSDNKSPNKSICSEAWPLFHPVLDVVKREFVGDKIVGNNNEYVLLFFSNLCCDPSHAVEVYDNVKDLLDGWFTVIKKKKHEWGIKYWAMLLSMISTVPSLVPHISPKYDANMEWCKNNVGLGWSLYYSRYLGNCYPSLKKWSELVETIKKSPDSESTSKLYHEHRDEILSVFLAFQSKSEIEEHKREIILCAQCLRWFVRHVISGNDIYLPIPDLNDLIDTFIGHLSRCEEVLEGDVDEEYCRICMSYTFKVHDKWDTFLPKISPTFQHILETGSKEKLGGNVALHLLSTLSIISISTSSSTRSSIFTLIKPYIRDWLRIYNDSECYGRWMFILSHITLSSDNKSPNKPICSEAWPLFHPVLDVVKREFVGDKIVGDEHERVLFFFSNLCCDPSHAVEVYDNVKDILDGWFIIIKKEKHRGGIIFWSDLISMLSTVPSLVPHISPQYDANMEWCKNNGGYNGDWYEDYSRYLGNCYPSLKKWSDLVESINKCPDSESTSKLYHEHRDEILSVFLAFQSKSEIEEHKREIGLCVQCLMWFVGHVISGNDIYLPIPDLNDLIDTFIGHLSRCEEVLEGDVDEEYCRICVIYTFKVHDKRYSFLPKISPTFQHILERGSKEKLGGDVALRLLSTLRNISISTSSSTRSSILTLIKPYIRDWLRIYNDSKCYGSWMVILSHITLSSDNKSPNKSICSEAWPLFHPVLDVVKREFVGDKIVGDDHERVLFFFSNLCCDPLHAVEVFDNIKSLLEGCFKAIQSKRAGYGIPIWSRLISMFSSVPSLIPQISPSFDSAMKWCNDNGRIEDLLRLKLIEADDEFLGIIKVKSKDSKEKEEKDEEKAFCTIFDHDYQRFVDNCKYKSK